MSSVVTMRVRDPNEIVLSMEITLTLGQWRDLWKNLEKPWLHPANLVADAIDRAILIAEKQFIP